LGRGVLRLHRGKKEEELVPSALLCGRLVGAARHGRGVGTNLRKGGYVKRGEKRRCEKGGDQTFMVVGIATRKG